jgi:hypothetical protein
MSFFVKAAVHALKKYPVVNASVDGTDIVYHGYFDIGVAVGSPRGLVVPVVRNVDQMNFAQIENQIGDYGKRAQEGKLGIEELSGGTFSISNGGVFGSMLSTPIINPPQAAILGVKLRHLAAWNERRRIAAGWYRSALADVPGVVLPAEAPWTGRHVYHLFVVRLVEHNRDAVAKFLAARGIQTVVHYPIPIHRQKAYAELGYAEGAFPRAEQAARTVLSLPMFPEMTADHVGLVADALRAALAA